MHFSGCLMNFLADGCLGQAGVFSAHGFQHHAKIVQALLLTMQRAQGVSETDGAPTADAPVKHSDHRRKGRAAGGIEEHIVETVLGFEDFLRIAGVVSLGSSDQRFLELLNLGQSGLLGKQSGGESFKNRADGIEVPGFLDGHSANNGALVRNDGDEPFRLELAKGFADDRAGNPHHRNQLTFDEALARMETARNNGLAELVENLAAQRGCGFGNGRERSGRKRRT